jgi:hypothetical protein
MPKQFVAVVSLCALAACFAVQQVRSENPAPCPAPKAALRRPPKQVSQCCCGQSSAEQRGSEASPFVIKLIQSDQAQKETGADKPATPKEPNQAWNLSDKIAAIASIAAFLQFLALVATIWIIMRNGQRQLRAYVIVERGIVANVADPISEYGKGQATVAQLRVPSTGPVAQITIKNTGQTPAYNLVHWGNMEVREFPLTSRLPEMPPPPEPFWSVLGPTIAEVKTLRIKNPLTEEEIQGLRDGNKAIYCHGTIVYRDAFKKVRTTHYRVMYCAITGIEIGTSTDLTVCSQGNEAD